MCSVFGAIIWGQRSEATQREAKRILEHITSESRKRGRDGFGFKSRFAGPHAIVIDEDRVAGKYESITDIAIPKRKGVFVLIGNTRAEPTTEFVREKQPHDQQPYACGSWSIVHNGTIANDKELRAKRSLDASCATSIDSAAIAETVELHFRKGEGAFPAFEKTVRSLKGSYAIIATCNYDQSLYVAANYRPIWYIVTLFGAFFASTRDSFPSEYIPRMVTPYSIMHFRNVNDELLVTKQLLDEQASRRGQKALVVCSGGLDSVVSAAYAKTVLGYDIELFHVQYGSRAEGPEVHAIKQIAEHMGVTLKLMSLPVYSKSDSPLLDPDAKVAGGEEGAEFAHEWVPARNLLLLALATAYAEANGFRWLVLGNNLEEAGAYPDNEPEFIAKYNDLLPFAIGDGKKLEVIMPVGNMMKHEIVALGAEVGAPMHLTWSCYRAGHIHCGTCGPCFMRRTAFQINNMAEVIPYEK
jgi:7-cyano-7-deazaguanine synthase